MKYPKHTIVAAVREAFGIKPDDEPNTIVRVVATGILREDWGCSLPEIAALVGGPRSRHSTFWAANQRWLAMTDTMRRALRYGVTEHVEIMRLDAVDEARSQATLAAELRKCPPLPPERLTALHAAKGARG